MNWIVVERRGPEWKQSWTERTISSITAPPLHLIAIFLIVVFYLFLPSYITCREEIQRFRIGFRIFLFLLPVMLILLVRSFPTESRFFARVRRVDYGWIHRGGTSPWGVALLVGWLLLLVSYQPTIHNNWFRPLWHTCY